MKELIKLLLSPKEFKKCSTIFNNSDKRFKNQWNCFLTANSWIQFFNDLLILSNGIRSSVLIDYQVPEWEDLIEFLDYLKSIKELEELLLNIELIYLDDYLFFIINKIKLIERCNIDKENQFENYKFINVSTSNENPINCNFNNHNKFLNQLINYLINNNNNNNYPIKLNQLELELELSKNYYPILSGWLCEYPIIYCNSSYFKNCLELNQQFQIINSIDMNELLKSWDNNNLSDQELIKIQVQFDQPISEYLNPDILKIQSIIRLCAFTCPLSLLSNNNDNELVLINYQNRIKNRFNLSNLKNYWKDIQFIKQVITNPSIKL